MHRNNKCISYNMEESSLQQISGWYLGLRSVPSYFTSGPCSCTPSSGRDSSFLRLPAHVARRRAGHISSVPSHDRISFAPRPRVDGGAVGDCNWDDLSSPSNILFNLSHGRNTFPNTSGGSPLLGRHRQWYVIHRIFRRHGRVWRWIHSKLDFWSRRPWHCACFLVPLMATRGN